MLMENAAGAASAQRAVAVRGVKQRRTCSLSVLHPYKVSGDKVRQKWLRLFWEMKDGLESSCDSHAFGPPSHLLGQFSLRLRDLQCT